VSISRLTLKDQHRAETNQSETRSLNERKRLAEIKRGKPCKNDKRDDFLYALQLGGRVDRVADPIGRHREQYSTKAIPQLTKMANTMVQALNLRLPYHANVMKMLEQESSRTGRM
jgi:hypothetical protein